MKTGKFLSVLSLASLMVACSSEEFEAPQQNAELSLRPNIESGLTFDFGANTKMAVEGNAYYPSFTENDILGAAVVDMPNYKSHNDYADMLKKNNGDASELYTFTDQISSNYPYTYAGGKWTTPAKLVEGNYLFYAPYSEKNLTKAPIMIVTPAKQDASTEKKALEDLANNTETPVVLGAQFLSAAGSMKPSVNMYDVFSYPMFTIENNFDGYLSEGGKLTAYKGAVKVKSVTLLKAKEGLTEVDGTFVVADAIKNELAGSNVPKWGKTTFDADEAKSGTWSITGVESKITTDQVTAKKGVITTLTMDNEIVLGGSYTFYAVMPAAAYGKTLCALVNIEVNGKEYVVQTGTIKANASKAEADKFEANVLNEGDAPSQWYSHNFVIEEDVENETGVTLLRGQRYPREMMNFNAADGSFASLKKDPESLLTINLLGGKITAKANDVDGQVAVIKEEAEDTRYVDSNEGLLALCDKQNNLTLKEVENVDAIETINDFVIAPENTITVNAALIEGLKSKLSKGTLTVKSVLAIDTKEVTVKVVSDVKGDAEKKNITFGVIGTNIEYPITMEITDLASEITKSGTYYNSSSSTVSVAKLPKNTKEQTFKVNIINNGGTVTISATKNFESLLSVSNVSGTLTIASELDNKALGIYNAGTLAVNDNTNAFIYNATGATATIAESKGVYTAAHNDGTITPGEGATLSIASGKGEVKNDAFATVTNNSAEQKVIYTIEGDYSTEIANTNKYTGINTVIFSGTVNATTLGRLIAPIRNVKTVKVLEFHGDITTAFEVNQSLSGMSLKFEESVTWSGVNKDITKFTDAKVEIAETKKLTLDNITVNGTKSGKGTISTNMSASTNMK